MGRLPRLGATRRSRRPAGDPRRVPRSRRRRAPPLRVVPRGTALRRVRRGRRPWEPAGAAAGPARRAGRATEAQLSARELGRRAPVGGVAAVWLGQVQCSGADNRRGTIRRQVSRSTAHRRREPWRHRCTSSAHHSEMSRPRDRRPPSSTIRRAIAGLAPRRAARRRSRPMPSASSVSTHSAVSAAVTQSPLDTQRTPRPSSTKVDQPSAMRRRPTSSSTAPDSMG